MKPKALFRIAVVAMCVMLFSMAGPGADEALAVCDECWKCEIHYMAPDECYHTNSTGSQCFCYETPTGLCVLFGSYC